MLKFTPECVSDFTPTDIIKILKNVGEPINIKVTSTRMRRD